MREITETVVLPSSWKSFDEGSMKSQKRDNMMAWTVVLHALAEPELSALPADIQARFLHIAELLETFGPQRVGLPHVRPLESKLWEMRMQGRDGIARAVYAAVQDRRLLVLHAFVKKTQTTPRGAIETALERLKAHHENAQNPENRIVGTSGSSR
jgi:phage-related protein